MVQNMERADWAEEALKAFAEACMPGAITDDTVVDLVCDLGHFCKLKLGFTDAEVVALYQSGVGAWKAEADHPLGEPANNRMALIQFEN